MTNKKFKLKVEEIKKLINSDEGCLATDRITVDGCKVGFMYREQPSNDYADSGWRFFAGDETDEYTADTNNIEIYKLNTICNYDSSIIPFLDSEIGKAFYKNANGKFKIDKESKQ